MTTEALKLIATKTLAIYSEKYFITDEECKDFSVALVEAWREYEKETGQNEREG